MQAPPPRLPEPAPGGLRWEARAILAVAGSWAALLIAPRWLGWPLMLLSVGLVVYAGRVAVNAHRNATTELKRLRAALLKHHRANAVGQVVAAAAHDIKNPLTVALGFAELARTTAEETRAVPPKLVRWLKDVEVECQRTSGLINDLLHFARGEVQEPAPRKTNDWVRGAATLVKPQVRLRGASLVEEYAEDAGAVVGDQHQLRYLVLNLLLNARDAVGDGGTVTVRTSRDGERIQVRVVDDGPGLPPEVRERLFTPYLAGRGEGAGLGLAVSREIARAHGGTLTTEPVQPHGTAMILTLPAATAEAEQVTGTARSA